MRPGACIPFFAFALPCAAQQFVRNTADIPGSTGYTENVDFADVDRDGDWDAAFANGGDFGNQQSVLWANQGGLQGGALGVFVDVTATQFPVLLCDSRDLEFADIDGDTDVDLYLVNTSSIGNQPCRFWVNQGGSQGGTAGFFQDETAARWVGLGQPGSSLPPGQVLGSGGFIDYSSDADFADFDNDGDLDLFHSSPGAAFNGNAPSRVFLNDGGGNFHEYNPSGFQLPGGFIVNGNPGLWCEGAQQANTTDSTGANCDIAASCIDLDIADIDGDYDLDVLLGSRQEQPRMFRNRYAEKAGVLGFRDVSGASFVGVYTTGTGHYAQEFGDMDSDGDWDILGVNWLVSFNFNDATYLNNGAGLFGPSTTLANSGPDDNEGDYFDYDEDGDLDLFISNFSGQERAYRNDGAGGYTHMATGVVLPSDSTNTLDSDTCDVDSDGDVDVFVANGGGQVEWYLENTTTADDTSAPLIVRLEQAPNRVAGPAPTIVRAEVQDNSAYYTSWYLDVDLVVQLNGAPPLRYPMTSSMGQVFRGSIPGSFVGLVDYRVVATDEHGNASSNGPFTYLAAGAGTLGTPTCFGDGTQSLPCPCANSGAAGRGCANSSSAAGALLTASGAVQPDSVVFQADGLVPNALTVFLQASLALPAPLHFGDGLRCGGGQVVRLYTLNAIGTSLSAPLPGAQGVRVRSAAAGDLLLPGAVRLYQAWYRDGDPAFCPAPAGSVFNTTNGLQITW